MNYVLDASVALKWVLPEPASDKAIALQEAVLNRLHVLSAPDTLSVETAHALTRAERKGLLAPTEAIQKFYELSGSFPELRSYLTFLPRAIELSSAMRVGVYDCLYIALAEHEGCRVVTADQRLLNAFPDQTISLDSLP